MKKDIMAVYGRGAESLGEINWESVTGLVRQGTNLVMTVAGAGKQLFSPTKKASTNYITGSTAGGTPVQPYNIPSAAPFPIVPVAIGAGALLLVMVFMLKK